MLKSCSEQSVDQQYGRLRRLIQLFDFPLPLRPRGFCRRGLRFAQGSYSHLDPTVGEMARGDIPVAAVISWSAEDESLDWTGEAISGFRECCSGPLH